LLTNVHNWILREILRRKKKNYSLDIFLYNIAPDALPLHKDISPEFTHNLNLTEELLKKYPKLIYVQYHILVDNIGHYGDIFPSNCKKGYAYIKGEKIIENVKNFYKEFGENFDKEIISYLAHTVVEIALDFKISKDDPTISELFFKIQTEISQNEFEEYVEAISALYKIDREIVREARKEPFKFYGKIESSEDFFLTKRTKLILRKTKKEFTEENISSAKNLVEEATKYLNDYKLFLEDAVFKLENFYSFSSITTPPVEVGIPRQD
jgi:hypothetical protein